MLCEHARMPHVQCLACLTVTNVSNASATTWDCACGSSYVFRRCASCSLASQVRTLQRRGQSWQCQWCREANTGFGLIVMARNYFSDMGASFRTLVGGEVAGYTTLLIDSRKQARDRMWREARARGANAVVAMRFDCNEIGGLMSEVAAYGTAVTVEPLPPGQP